MKNLFHLSAVLFLVHVNITMMVMADTNSSSLCLVGSTPFALSTLLSPPYQCAPGFYCPNTNRSDPNTYPTLCTPTSDCQIQRLQFKFCVAQGVYDPVICPAGFYCPTDHEMIICPEGYFCPVGRSQPIQCPLLSTCPAGSSRRQYMGSVVWILCVDAFVALTIFLYQKFQARQNAKRTTRYQNLEGLSVTVAVDLSGKMAKLPKYTQTLCRGFERARQDYMLAELDSGRLRGLTADQLSSHRYLMFEFKDLSLSIPLASGGSTRTFSVPKSTKKDSPRPYHPSQTEKLILTGVTGSIKPGKVTAIMGPSGAGKTTFLNVLLGKVESSWRRGGTLNINGYTEEVTKYKRIIGYVPQEDIMHTELTVYQNIKFSADLRLPRSWTSAQRERHTQAVLAAMQLSSVHFQRIGDTHTRGVSGGQRKRVNIGMELAAAPSALFLDEPTSGLDSSAALDVCRVLKDVASTTHMTVAMVIHQPRVEIWNSLDQLLLLAPGGKTVYEGPQSLCQAYFVNYLGLALNPQDNPADAIMDAIASEGQEYARRWSINGPATLQSMPASCMIPKPRSVRRPARSLHPVADREDAEEEEEDTDDPKTSAASSSSLAAAAAAAAVAVASADATASSSSSSSSSSSVSAALKGASAATSTADPTFLVTVQPNNATITNNNMNSVKSVKSELDVVKWYDDDDTFTGGHRRAITNNVALATVDAISAPTAIDALTEKDASSAEIDISDDEEDLEDLEDLKQRRETIKQAVASQTASTETANATSLSSSSSTSSTPAFSLSDLKSDGVSHARGASFVRQVWLFHQRNLQQQLTKFSSLVLELIVSLAAGLIMGVSANGNYQGILIQPYTLISPGPQEWLVPQVGMFICMSISLAAASAGVRVFNEEQVEYWREVSSGAIPLAYFLGVTIASIYRQFLDALHFTFIYHILSNTIVDFAALLLLVFFQFLGTYGLGALISQVTVRENGALVAVVVALILSVFNGYAQLPNFLQYLTPGYWMTSALFTEMTASYESVMQVEAISAPIWGFTLHQFGQDVALMLVVGIAYRAFAFFFMVTRNRDKQK